MAPEPLDELAQASRDLAHITIGLGILAFQKAQVQRRSIERSFAARDGDDASSSTVDRLDHVRRSIQNLRDCR